MQINQSSSYRVYLNNVIVPWFDAADDERGWVDVWALSSAGEPIEGVPFAVCKHRLFGQVSFEKVTVTI